MTQRQTLLTTPDWEGQCPPMPGRHGPTYAEQIEFVQKWMAPMMRDFYERLQWRQNPHLIYSLYTKSKEWSRIFENRECPNKP